MKRVARLVSAPGGGTILESKFYVTQNRIEVRGVKRQGLITWFGLKLD
jgi:hypothetical protein